MIALYFRFALIFSLTFLFATPAVAQTSKKKLEAKRKRLKQEIKKIKNYLDKTEKKERSISHQVTDLKQKIDTRENLISTINKEISIVHDEIAKNEDKIQVLKTELELLKKDYAELMYQSYKNKTRESTLMLILSSDNFYQGYQRFQYMRQYTNYRKSQGDSIQSKASKLQVMNDSLAVIKTHKHVLIDEKKHEQKQIGFEKEKQEELVVKYRKKKKQYLSQIKKKQRDERKLQRQIEAAIRKAIKKSTGSKKSEFAMSPAAKVLAGKFVSNKGKLPWPVKKGLVTVRFGTHPDPMDTSLKISSSGVRIATNENAAARAIFEGEVMAIQKNTQNGVLSVLIQHGNYISVYVNLKEIFVSKGDKVKTKEDIGIIHTDQVTGKTILKFQIWKNVTAQNPSKWVYKLR